MAPAPQRHKPLAPRQQLAAGMIGEGRTHKEAAEAVSVSTRAVSEWCRREDFKALVQQARDRVLDEAPTARAVLEAALSATFANGRPDWKSRIAAARALTGLDGPKPPAPGPRRALVIHTDNLDLGGAPSDPRTKVSP